MNIEDNHDMERNEENSDNENNDFEHVNTNQGEKINSVDDERTTYDNQDDSNESTHFDVDEDINNENDDVINENTDVDDDINDVDDTGEDENSYDDEESDSPKVTDKIKDVFNK